MGLTNPSITLFIDETAAAKTTYTYRVIATSSVGDSGASNNSVVITPAVANLAGQWNLDEGVGLSTADVSGNNNNGVLHDEVTWIDGQVGAGSLNFHGAGVHHARARGGQLQHLLVADVAERPRLRAHARVRGVDARHVRVDLAGVGLQRRQIGRAHV